MQASALVGLHHLEAVTTNEDIGHFEVFFDDKMERNLHVLNATLNRASLHKVPWPGNYWASCVDGLNNRWKGDDEPSAVEKYAAAFGKDAQQLAYAVSQASGVDQYKSTPCATKADCAAGNECGKRREAATGYCMPAWYGICHAWAAAAIMEPEPVLSRRTRGLSVDVDNSDAVWNQPIRAYDVQELTFVDPNTFSGNQWFVSNYPFNARMKFLVKTRLKVDWIDEAYVDGELAGRIDEFTRSKIYEYVLELNANYEIIGGEWINDSILDHPDQLWIPVRTPRSYEVSKTGFVYAEIQQLLKESIACSTPAPPTPAPTTSTPEPTSGKPTLTPEPSSSKPTLTPEPSSGKPTLLPEPSSGKPAPSPEPSSGKPTLSPEPSSGKPTLSPEPSSGKPTFSSEPSSGKPTSSPEPSSGKPTLSPEPSTGKPTTTPEPSTPVVTTPTPTTPQPTKTPVPATPMPTTPAPTTAAPTKPMPVSGGQCGSDKDGVQPCPSGEYCQPWNSMYYQCRAIDTAKCGQQEVGVDFNGDDIATVEAALPELCCDKCRKTKGCKAYTFINYNADGKTRCYLKSGSGSKQKLVGAVSAIVSAPECAVPSVGQCGNNKDGVSCCPSGEYCQPWNPFNYQCRPAPKQCATQDVGVDYAGDDMKTIESILPWECCDRCAETAGCKAYTFVNYNSNGKSACYLKSGTGKKQAKVGAVSATVLTPRA